MRNLLYGLLSLSLVVLMSSAYVITRLQLAPSAHITVKPDEPEVVKVGKTIERLNAKIAELQTLETKIKSASLDEALASGVELTEKIKQYGTLESLQADLRAMNEIKTELQAKSESEVKTSSNETITTL